MTLSDDGVANRGGHRGTQHVGAGPCNVFIHRRRTSCVALDVYVSEFV